MDIKVDRTVNPEGNLIFTITVKEPHHACFDEVEKNIMGVLDFCKTGVENLSPEENKLRQDVVALIHLAKEKTFNRVLNSLKFAIKEQLQPIFDPICQEIFNWIHDNQKDVLKNWMNEFNSQRTTYYFDNDSKSQYCRDPNSLSDDKFDDDEEDDEDED